MVLEQYNNPVVPLFVTLTYSDKNLPENNYQVTKEVQKFLKRLRRKYGDIRYFAATEKGSKNGRVHNHLIIWSKELNDLQFDNRRQAIRERWNLGRTDTQVLRNVSGMFYTAKYVCKNINKKTNFRQEGQLFQYSQKPMLGTNGFNRWKYLVLKQHQVEHYSSEKLPPGFLVFPVFGRIVRAWIPRDTYKRFVQNEMGILLMPGIKGDTQEKYSEARQDQEKVIDLWRHDAKEEMHTEIQRQTEKYISRM